MKPIEILKKVGAITVPTKAEEIMGSPVFTVRGNQTVGEALEILKEKDIGQLVVVDDHDHLIGDIGRFAVIDALIERGINTMVVEVKRTDDYDIFSPDTDLLEIQRALKEVPAVFIAEDNRPVGVIKKEDFFKEYK